MVQTPDSLRQLLAPVVKYRFWILSFVVPLLLLPALFLANGARRAVISRERATIDGHVSALNGVRNEPNHPNAAWSESIDRQAAAIKDELLREWATFWESQQSLRTWPKALGPDFLSAIEAVESGGRRELQFRDLQRYQNTVPNIVRQLPDRMGCEELMTNQDEDAAGGPLGRGGRRSGGGGGSGDDEGDDPDASRPLPILVWRPEDQKRLIGSFTWNKPPSTTQVLLAQEELWVYGLFCDAIKNVNEGATGHFDSRITQVEELAVGYPAAEDAPGGQGTGRVIGPPLDPGGGPPGGPLGGLDTGLPPTDAGLPGDSSSGPQGRPPHPRFGGFAGAFDVPMATAPGLVAPPSGTEPSADPGGEPKGPAVSPDDMFRQWIYSDFNGRPLTAQDLKTKPDAQFVHLMPFVLRVVVDQRQIDRMLAELAACQVPVDVRQVRINPSGPGQQFNESDFGRSGGGLPGGGFGPDGGSAQGQRRPFDVTVELRGTVGLATPPNKNVFGSPAGKDQALTVNGGI
ncbi:MAG: hypothetical protein FJ284_02175 [Planctomycetes bacterium]|nr:hypothetical protein [Planctomycetota bacterium]